MVNKTLGQLYIAATPIGNLEDISRRFCQVVQQVNGVLCEDTRHSKKLFSYLGITPRLQSFHQHNEEVTLDKVIARLVAGEQWMLVCDAGMPIIQDPGYRLVRECHQQGIKVSILPGACAAVSALCLSGQPAHAFQFEGYLPTKQRKRKEKLLAHRMLPHSLIYYLSTHRVLDEMADVLSVYEADRQMSLVKEMTKINENVVVGNAETLLEWLMQSALHVKGEFALVIHGWQKKPSKDNDLEGFEPSNLSLRCMTELRSHLPLKTAIKITAKISSQPSKALYHFFTSNPPK